MPVEGGGRPIALICWMKKGWEGAGGWRNLWHHLGPTVGHSHGAPTLPVRPPLTKKSACAWHTHSPWQ